MSRALLFGVVLLLACDPETVALPDAGPVARVDGGPDAGPPADLDGYITYQMAVGGIPGLAAAIITPDGVPWVATYGLADADTGAEVDEHTLFIMASISKTVAAVRAMQLVEAGLLDLDAPVEDYVGYAARHPAHPDTPITTRMLFTHTSGLVDDFLILAGVTTADTDPTETLAGFSEGYTTPGGAYYDADNWGAAPGTRRVYANAGFGVIGHVLEEASEQDLRAQTETAVFTPLALDGAGWFLEDVERARLASEHAWNGRSFAVLPHRGFAFYPASSWRVSITGLSRYGRMLLRGGELDGVRVLEQASVDELFRIQFPSVSGGQALAFSDRRVGGQRYVGHSGATFGGSTQLLLSRDLEHGILVITNSDAYVRARIGLTEGDEAMERILERVDQEARALR